MTWVDSSGCTSGSWMGATCGVVQLGLDTDIAQRSKSKLK